MKTKLLAAVLSIMVLSNTAAPIISESDASAENSYNVDVNVNVDGYRKAISPYIYGMNTMQVNQDYNYNITSARQGGNRFTAYNWENNYSNAGRDWYHSSDNYLVNDRADTSTPGKTAINFANANNSAGIPYKITTIQMGNYVSADDDGEVTEDEIAPSDRWKEVKAFKGSELSMTPDQTDNYVYMDEYVNYLVKTLGDSMTSTGYQGYNLDNEPGIWSGTHSRMHPEKTTCNEIISKSIEYAKAVKSIDPYAEVYGGVLSGFGAYSTFCISPDWTDKYSNEYDWFISCFLDKMSDAEEDNGKRLLDVLDLHYYPEAMGQERVIECNDYTHTDCIEARLQSPRTLYDGTYIENSWIGNYNQQYLPILPKVQKSIDTYYPGTKLSFTEYNFGGEDHISGAVTEADVLGIFASNDVYLATHYPLTKDVRYILAAINLYTNYDGKGSSFGDTLVTSSTSDIEKATVYSSIKGSDESKLTMVLTNKSLEQKQLANININSNANYTSAKIYGITDQSDKVQLLDTISNIKNNSFTAELPALSVVQIELTADDNYTIIGDVNTDGTVDVDDLKLLSNWLLTVPGTDISWKNADVTGDEVIDSFDLCKLRSLIAGWMTPEDKPEYIAFWNTKIGQWRIKNGMSGKTVRFTFKGDAGNRLNLVFGYWDPVTINTETGNAGIWVNNDSTKLGWFDFDESGKAVVDVKIPENAMNVEIIAYNYVTVKDGINIQLDKDSFELESVIELQ